MAIARFLAASLFLASLTATAQRGGGSGHASGGGFHSSAPSGFSARSAPAGSFSSTPRPGSARPSAYRGAPSAYRSAVRPGMATPAYRASGVRYGQRPSPNVRPGFYQNGQRRSFYNRNRGIGINGYGYGYVYPGYIDTGFWDDSLYDTDDAPVDQGSASPPPGDPNAYNYGPIAANTPTPTQPRPVVPSAPIAPTQATTLIFKDGRPADQIYSYLATHSTITVFHGARHTDIPVDDIDIAATEKANKQAGVDFQLP